MKTILLVALTMAIATTAFPQAASREDTIVSLSAFPHAILPLPSASEYFTTGFGANLSLDIPLPFMPAVAVRADIGYSFLPVWTSGATNLFRGTGGLTVRLPVGQSVSAELLAGGGYYYGIIGDGSGRSGGNALFGAGVRIAMGLGPGFSPGIEARYSAALDGLGGFLYHGVSLGVSTRFNLLRRRELQIEEIQLEQLFPVLYKTYTDEPIGTAMLVNASPKPIQDLSVTLFVERYMDSPWECPAPASLAAGESARIDLVALFSETELLAITEATVVTGVVTATYTQDDRGYRVERPASLRINDRHAITWDDDRKAAAYVTYKDPTLVDIATSIARIADTRSGVVDTNLRTAIALHEAFRRYDLTYRIDPTTPYIELSETTDTIDYLQFPRNTLKRRAGDCDDLSILYAAALQAVGIDTAFITIPGHIYMAFVLKSAPDASQRLFSDPDDIIIHDDRAWIPIEITLVDAPFVEAWKTGARQWVTSNADGTARIFPLSDAWLDYEPVGQVGDFTAAEFIGEDVVAEAFAEEIERFVAQEIYAQTSRYQRELDGGAASPRTLNRVGSVYARYGQYETAREYFNQATADRPYPPALMNLGNLALAEGDAVAALGFLERFSQGSAETGALLLQFARAYNLLGDYEASEDFYGRLVDADPALAQRHLYLDLNAGAASRASSRRRSEEDVPWMEE